MKVKYDDFLKYKLNEDFKSQTIKFINSGVEKHIVDSYLSYFKEIKDKKYKQLFDEVYGVEVPINRRGDIDAYKTFHELEMLVDYVRGQVSVKGAHIDHNLIIDIKPIYDNNGLEIYYANTPKECVKLKGNIPYSWCICRDDVNNMFYTYRMKDHHPTFYFVKFKDRTDKELQNIGDKFDGIFTDKYHYFVVQVDKDADLENLIQKQYKVTSANNDGDKDISWYDMLKIDNRLTGLERLLKPVQLSEQELMDFEFYSGGMSDEKYRLLDYDSKKRFIDVFVNPSQFCDLTDKQFEYTPHDLKNFYIGLGVPLSKGKFQIIKNDNKLLNRYKKISETLVKKSMDDINIMKELIPSQINVCGEDIKNEFFCKMDEDRFNFMLGEIDFALYKYEYIIKILKLHNNNILTTSTIGKIVKLYKEQKCQNIINLIVTNKKELDVIEIQYILSSCVDFDKTMYLLGDENIKTLLSSPMNVGIVLSDINEINNVKLINKLFKFKELTHKDKIVDILITYGKNKNNIRAKILKRWENNLSVGVLKALFDDNNHPDTIADLIIKQELFNLSPKEMDIIIDELRNDYNFFHKHIDFLINMNKDNIKNFLPSIGDTRLNRDNFIKLALDNCENVIDGGVIFYMIELSTNTQDIIQYMGEENFNKLSPKEINILKKLGKL